MVSCHISTLRLSKAFYASLSQFFYPSFSHFHFQTVPILPLPWVFKMQCQSCKRPIVLDCQTHPLQCFQLSKCCHTTRCWFTHRCRCVNFHSLKKKKITQKVYPKLCCDFIWLQHQHLVVYMAAWDLLYFNLQKKSSSLLLYKNFIDPEGQAATLIWPAQLCNTCEM